MKISDAFPSTYLKADDLNGSRPVVVIRSIKFENLGDERKSVLYFEGKDKGLVLNKTNANAITDILGTDETDYWVGARIRLYPIKVDYQGKRVLAIRIEEAPVSQAAVRQAKQQPPAQEYDEQGRGNSTADLDDSDIPF